MREHKRASGSHGASASGDFEGFSNDRLMRIMRSAQSYNQAHESEVEEFNQVTQYSCASGDTGVSVRKVMEWQRSNGLTADGKVGPSTVQKANETAVTEFSEEEADPIVSGAGGSGGGTPQDTIGSSASTDADASGAETAAAENASNSPHMPEEKDDDGPVSKKLGKATGKAIKYAAKESDLLEGMPNGQTGVKVAAGMMMIPYIVTLLQKHEYKKVIDTIIGMASTADKVKILTAAIKAAGVVSPAVEKVLFHAMTVGMFMDVAFVGWEFVAGSFKALAKAKAEGEAESLIGIYAYAWSSVIMTGGHSNPGAVTGSQQQAKQDGMSDGFATLAGAPELPFLMLAEFGSEDNARKALQDALYKREGIDVRNHE